MEDKKLTLSSENLKAKINVFSSLNINEIVSFAVSTLQNIEKNHAKGISFRVYPDLIEFGKGRIIIEKTRALTEMAIEDDLIAFGNCIFFLLTGRSWSFGDLLDPASMLNDAVIPLRLRRLLEKILSKRLQPDHVKNELLILKDELSARLPAIGFRLNKERNQIHENVIYRRPLSISPVWSFAAEAKIISSPIIYGDILYCAASDKKLYMIDKNKGELLMDIQLISSVESTPVLYDRKLYIGDDEGNFYLIDIMTGQIKLTKNLDSSLIRSSPLIAGQSVFIGTYDGNLYSLCREDLEVKYKIRNKGWIYSSCTYLKEKNAVIAVWDKGRVGIYSEDYGSMLWDEDFDDTIRSTPVICNGRVFLASFRGFMYIIDINSNRFEVTAKIDLKAKIFSTPVIKDNKIVVASMQKDIICLDLSDNYRTLWKIRSRNPIISSPVVFDNYVTTVDESGFLYIIDIRDGKICLNYNLESFCRSTPFIERDMLFIASSNVISAFKL